MKNKIREYRERAGLTQEQLASLLRVSQTTISFFESGKRFPDVTCALRMALILRCKVEDIFLP